MKLPSQKGKFINHFDPISSIHLQNQRNHQAILYKDSVPSQISQSSKFLPLQTKNLQGDLSQYKSLNVNPKYQEKYGELFQGAAKIVQDILTQQQLMEKDVLIDLKQKKHRHMEDDISDHNKSVYEKSIDELSSIVKQGMEKAQNISKPDRDKKAFVDQGYIMFRNYSMPRLQNVEQKVDKYIKAIKRRKRYLEKENSQENNKLHDRLNFESDLSDQQNQDLNDEDYQKIVDTLGSKSDRSNQSEVYIFSDSEEKQEALNQQKLNQNKHRLLLEKSKNSQMKDYQESLSAKPKGSQHIFTFELNQIDEDPQNVNQNTNTMKSQLPFLNIKQANNLHFQIDSYTNSVQTQKFTINNKSNQSSSVKQSEGQAFNFQRQGKSIMRKKLNDGLIHNTEVELKRDQEDILRERQEIQLFFKNFKTKDKNKRDSSIPDESAYSRYIDKCEDFMMAPRPFGIVHRKGNRYDINMNDQTIGDNYAQALAEGLQVLDTPPSSIILKNNNLTDAGVTPIIKSLAKTSPDLLILDLSQNHKISVEGYQVLLDAIDQEKFIQLEQLNLEGNLFGDRIMKNLGNVMAQNNSIRLLNISQNKITDEGAKYIAHFLKINTCCNVLFMRWNQIKAKGASIISKSLLVNDCLQIWDASFNSFGSQTVQTNQNNKQSSMPNSDQQISKEQQQIQNDKVTKMMNFSKVKVGSDFCEMFKLNKTLIHLDLSHNNFNKTDCLSMELGLRENHSLLGLHMLGNEMNTNSQGFIKEDGQNDPSLSHIISRISPTLATGTISKAKVELKATSNCWICEGWSQILFKINPNDVIIDQKTGLRLYDEMDDFTLMYIHLSCDSEPDLMEKNSQTGEFSLLRMVPPGQINYYYSIGQPPLVNQAQQTFTKSFINKKKIEVPNTNIVQNVIQTREVITQTYLEDLSVLPRPPPKKINGILRLKTPWDFNKSVFKDYIFDNEMTIARCFEYDWSNSKIPKIVKDESELSQIKAYLKSIYKSIRECYKHYAGINPQNDIPSIGQNAFQDFVNNCQILEGDLIKLSDVDLEFISTNAGNKNQRLNPDRALVRYQLMEICVRIAIFKYYKKVVNSTFEAVKMLFEQQVFPFISKFDSHDWRLKRLWNEECDMVYKYYYKVLQALFEKFSGKFSKPGMPKFMSLEEISTFATTLNILDDTFGPRELGIQFNLAQMTNITELETENHIKMNLIEFLDAFARIADKLMLDKSIKQYKTSIKERNL
eukprot:403347825